MTRRPCAATLAVALFLLVPVPAALALIGETPTIRGAAVVRSPIIVIGGCPIALLAQNADGSFSLILRTIDEENGALVAPDQVAAIPAGVVPVDLIFSTVFRPGSVLVLDEALRVHEFPVAVDAEGKAKWGAPPPPFGPFGDPAVVGVGTALGEAPVAVDPTNPVLGVGMSGGGLLIGHGTVDAADYVFVDLGKGTITSLATVPQVGSFAFVAATDGQAVGVSTGSGSTPPSVIFTLDDPRPHPFFDLSAVFEPNGEPLTSPAPVSFVAANGTTDVAILTIPASPTTGGTLTVGIVDAADYLVQRVALGSLVAVTADGTALFDPGFSVDSGPSGIEFTLAGASADIDPDVLNLGSNGKSVTAYLEVENGGAAHINLGSLALAPSPDQPAGCALPPDALKPLLDPPPLLGDRDEDGQADVTVKFDRKALEALLESFETSTAVIRIFWTYDDGSTACGHAILHIKRRPG